MGCPGSRLTHRLIFCPKREAQHRPLKCESQASGRDAGVVDKAVVKLMSVNVCHSVSRVQLLTSCSKARNAYQCGWCSQEAAKSASALWIR